MLPLTLCFNYWLLKQSCIFIYICSSIFYYWTGEQCWLSTSTVSLMYCWWKYIYCNVTSYYLQLYIYASQYYTYDNNYKSILMATRQGHIHTRLPTSLTWLKHKWQWSQLIPAHSPGKFKQYYCDSFDVGKV